MLHHICCPTCRHLENTVGSQGPVHPSSRRRRRRRCMWQSSTSIFQLLTVAKPPLSQEQCAPPTTGTAATNATNLLASQRSQCNSRWMLPHAPIVGLLPNISHPWFGFNLSLAALVTRDQGRAPRKFSGGDDNANARRCDCAARVAS